MDSSSVIPFTFSPFTFSPITRALRMLLRGGTFPLGSYEDFLFNMSTLRYSQLIEYYNVLLKHVCVSDVSLLIFDYFTASEPSLQCLLPFGTVMKIPDRAMPATIGCCTKGMQFNIFQKKMCQIEYPCYCVSYAINGEYIITTKDGKTPEHILALYYGNRIMVYFVCPADHLKSCLLAEHGL